LAGRFDESLPSADWYEFWIRVLAGGARGEVIEDALVGHDPSRESAYRMRLETARFTAGLRAVFDKHLPLFRRHAPLALCARDASVQALAGRYHRALRQRDNLGPERAALVARLERSVNELRAMNGEGLDWGDLRRPLPVSPNWGYERGTPIDRY